MSLIVQKYGGSSLATPAKIKQVASRVAQLRQTGQQLIVVVSAMGKTTDELIRLAHEVSPLPVRRELDMLLTTGERVSMALMSMALKDLNCPAISFTGSQAGVLTDQDHSNAKILDLKPIRLEAELNAGRVIVLAGFQGVDPISKEVTTLGRGGSDTTAVAMAGHFKADRCEILKDVEGVCSTDPGLVQKAKIYQELDYSSTADMCFWGAKVLHYRCVELAQRLNVRLFVGSSTQLKLGTLIHAGGKMFEREAVVGVNLTREVMHLKLAAANLDGALTQLDQFLKSTDNPWPQLLAAATEPSAVRLMVTAPKENLATLQRALHSAPSGIELMPGPHSAVSLTCYGSVGSDLASRALAILGKNSLYPEKFLTSATTLTFILKQEDGERAVKVLHQALIQG